MAETRIHREMLVPVEVTKENVLKNCKEFREQAEAVLDIVATMPLAEQTEETIGSFAEGLYVQTQEQVKKMEKMYTEMIRGAVSGKKTDIAAFSKHDLESFYTGFVQMHQTFELVGALPSDRLARFRKFLEVFTYSVRMSSYVFQDLSVRMLDSSEVPKEFVEMDKNKEVGEIFRTLKPIVKDRGERFAKISGNIYNDDHFHVIENIKIKCAHGVLANKIFNIIKNVISARDDIQAKSVWFDVELSEGFLEIKISDDGKGIPEENLKDPDPENPTPTNIFQLNFTTRSSMGLGLVDAKREIESMGGEVIVISIPVNDYNKRVEGEEYAGNGNIHTTFTIRVPLLKEAA